MNNEYPYLPEGRIIEYVSAEDPFMKEAMRMRADFSTDKQHATGSVVVLGGEIIGKGANQSALKSKALMDFHKNKFCMRRFLKIPSGQKYWLCPGCSSCRHHAETRAVKDALKNRKDIRGADLYLYGHWWCCKPCWDEMIKAGIGHVYLVDGARKLFEAKR